MRLVRSAVLLPVAMVALFGGAIAQQPGREGCEPRAPHELRPCRFLEWLGLPDDAPMAAASSADEEPPHTSGRKDCMGHMLMMVRDLPEDGTTRSNIESIIFDTAASSNYSFIPGSFQPGESQETFYSLIVIDLSKPARGIVRVRDRAGNITIDTTVYEGSPLIISGFPLTSNFLLARDGQKISTTFRMVNRNGAPAKIQRFLMKSGEGNFEIVEPKGAVTLAAGDSVDVIVQFIASVGERTSGVIVHRDSIGFEGEECTTYLELVEGQVVKPVISVTDHDFGTIPVDATSGVWMMEVRNVSTIAGSTLTVYASRGPNNSNGEIFTLQGGDAMPLFRLDPGESRSLQIRARPSDAIEYRDSILFSSDAVEGDSIGWMAVRGLSPDMYATSYDWRRRRVGYTYGPEIVYVHNIGTASARILSASIEGDADQFSIVNMGELAGRMIDVGDSLAVRVQFHPTSTGSKEARIIYQIDPAEPFPVFSVVRGFGTEPKLFTTDYDFGHMDVGGPEKVSDNPVSFWTPTTVEFDSVTILGFEFTTDSFGGMDDFRYQTELPTPLVLHAGERIEVTGLFSAKAPGLRTATLRAITNDGVDTTSRWYGNRPSSSAGGAAAESGSALGVAPNPVTGSMLTVRYPARLENAELALVDLLGRVVHAVERNAVSRAPGIAIVDVSAVPAGAYFLRLKTSAGAEFLPVTIVR